MRPFSLVAIAACSQPLFLAGLVMAKPATLVSERNTKENPSVAGRYRYHKPPMKPVKTVVVDNGAASAKSDVPQVVVYVDSEGHPIETLTQSVRVASSSPTPTNHIVVELAPPINDEDKQGEDFTPPSLVIDSASSPSPALKAANPAPIANVPPPCNDTASSRAATTALSGITYSPYNPDGSCKTPAQVTADVQDLAPSYSLIRIYGVNCDQVTMLLSAASSLTTSTTSTTPPAAAAAAAVRLFLGIFNIDDLDAQISTIVSAINSPASNPAGGWSLVDTVSIGNELVNNGQATPEQVVSALSAARSALRAAGFAGPVVTVDTFLAVLAHPELCAASDYCAMNIHPFFDADTSPDQAGNFVLRQIANVREVLPDPAQRVVVTESGWPWQGNANGKAIPGRENQQVAVQSIVDKVGGDDGEGLGNLILFTAFNDDWKKAEAGTFYAEQFWGMQ